MSATVAARKRGKSASGAGAGAGAGKRRRKGDSSGDKGKSKGGGKMNEEISSDSENESIAPRKTEEEEEEELEETAQEKKLRLAKLYLEQLKQQEEEKAEAREFEEDQVAGKLKEDVLEQRGRLQKSVAKEIQAPAPADIRILRGHQLSITCLVITLTTWPSFLPPKTAPLLSGAWRVDGSFMSSLEPRRVLRGSPLATAATSFAWPSLLMASTWPQVTAASSFSSGRRRAAGTCTPSQDTGTPCRGWRSVEAPTSSTARPMTAP